MLKTLLIEVDKLESWRIAKDITRAIVTVLLAFSSPSFANKATKHEV